MIANYCFTPMIVDSILGDAYVNKYGNLTIEHSLAQKDYVEWKFQKLKQLGVLTEKSKPTLVRRIHPRTQKEHQSLRFFTRNVFKVERAVFYPNGSKVIPRDFEQLCLPETLAFWFMDDGGRGGNTPMGMVLDVSSYTLQDVDRVSLILKDKWNIPTTIHHHSARAKKLYFKREGVEHFCHLIRPYMHESMLYKLVANSVGTP